MYRLSAFLVLALQALPQEVPSAPESLSPERGLRLHGEGAFAGYTLFAPLRSGTTFLIDMQGQEVFTWKTPHPGLAFYLMDDGRLLRASRINENPVFHGGGLGGRIQELAPDGSVTWEFVLSNEKQCLHHDVEPLPNGNVLAIAWEFLSKEEALALGRDPAHINGLGFWPDWLLEIEPARPSGGRIVWEWHAKDHLVQDFDPGKPGHGSVPENPGRIDMNADHRDRPPLTEEERRKQAELEAEMAALGYAGGTDGDAGSAGDADPDGPPKSGDWLHTNSVDYHPGFDLVLLSVPDLNEIWVIDHSTTTAEARGNTGGRWKKGGELLYRWGNPRTYGAGSDADRRLFFQHQAEWVPAGLPGAGNVTLFNNGRERPDKEFSTVEELALPFDPARGFLRDPGKPFGPAKPLWTYSDPENFYSFFISGCQRLPNGNTFICSGKQGRFFEVTAAGEIVWEYWNPHGGEIPMSMGMAAPPPPAPPPADPAAPAAVPGGPPPGGGSPVEPTSCFRATRIAPDHPALVALGVR